MNRRHSRAILWQSDSHQQPFWWMLGVHQSPFFDPPWCREFGQLCLSSSCVQCAQWIGGSPSILNKPKYDLVGGLEHVLFFHMLGTTKSQLTFHIFQRGGSSTSCSVGLTEPAASGKHTWLPKIKTLPQSDAPATNLDKLEKKWRKRVPKAIQQWHPAIHRCGQCYT